MRASDYESECWDKQGRHVEDEEVSTEYLELFRNEVEMRAVNVLLRVSARRRDGAGDIKNSIL